MKPIKIRMNEKFLEKMKQYPKEEGWLIDWMSPTGCKFQDMYSYAKSDWVRITPEDVFNYFKAFPNGRVKLSLIGNHSRWYSTCKVKNIYVEAWK